MIVFVSRGVSFFICCVFVCFAANIVLCQVLFVQCWLLCLWSLG